MRSLVKAWLLTEEDLVRYTKTNTHMYLVHCALEARRRADYLAIPDYKIKFKLAIAYRVVVSLDASLR
ncbi:MAG: hypothetical protein QXI56_08215 [Candidatus Bathyarchaeia archaeon]